MSRRKCRRSPLRVEPSLQCIHELQAYRFQLQDSPTLAPVFEPVYPPALVQLTRQARGDPSRAAPLALC